MKKEQLETKLSRLNEEIKLLESGNKLQISMPKIMFQDLKTIMIIADKL